MRWVEGKFDDAETGDVLVLVGEHKFHVHSWVLQINSTLMDHVLPHLVQGKKTVDLLEYSDYADTVRDFLESFYNPYISITRDNLEIVYKLSKLYDISWLLQHSIHVFRDLLPNNFPRFLLFAVQQEDKTLTDLSLSLLHPTLLQVLQESGDELLLQPSCLTAILAHNNVPLCELQLFHLVCRWYEHEPEGRVRHVEKLLSQLRFNLIKKEDLVGTVYDWISSVSGLSDSVRLELLIKINRYTKVPGLVSLPSPRTLGARDTTLSPNDENLLQLIVNSVQRNNSVGCPNRPDPATLSTVLRESFPRADPATKQCLVEYISDNGLVSESNITSLLQTYTLTQHHNVALLCVNYLSQDLVRNLHQVDWEVLELETVRDVLLQVRAGKHEYLVAEAVMRWLDAHPSATTTTKQELLAVVCTSNLYERYKKQVFLVHARKLVPGTRDLACTKHRDHPVITRPMFSHHSAPTELYLLKPFDIVFRSHVITLDKRDPARPLTIAPRGFGKKRSRQPGYFVLYDSKVGTERYPVAATLSLLKLREVVEKSAELHFMFLY